MSKGITYAATPSGVPIREFPLNKDGSSRLGFPSVSSYSNYTSLPNDNYWRRFKPKAFPDDLLYEPAYTKWVYSSVRFLHFENLFKAVKDLSQVRLGAKIINLITHKNSDFFNSRHLSDMWTSSFLVMGIRQYNIPDTTKVYSHITAKQNNAIPLDVNNTYYPGPGWHYGGYNAIVEIHGPGKNMSQQWFLCTYNSDLPENMLGTW